MDDYLPATPPVQPLTYEETPVIEQLTPPEQPIPVNPQPQPSPEPVAPAPQPISPKVVPPASTPSRSMSPIIVFVILALVFGVGVWASSYIRQFLSGVPASKQIAIPPTPIPVPPDPYANWKTYSIISGATHKAIDGVSLKLPPQITELFCDGTGCSSQGTTLPGGTRFTVAPRGAGQALTDYRGKIVTDFGGKPFVTTPIIVSGRSGLSFVGDFAGSTVTGYTFTKMRGAMISVTDSLSLEVNHFTPTSNPSADFASDDVLFTKILNSFMFVGLPTPLVTPSLSPTLTPTATSSGS